MWTAVRNSLSWLPVECVTSFPSNITEPLSGSIARMTSLATVVLPEPDAPATTSTLPRSRIKLTSSTALTTRSGRCSTPDLKSWRKLFLIGKYFLRFLASSSTSNYSSKLLFPISDIKAQLQLPLIIHTDTCTYRETHAHTIVYIYRYIHEREVNIERTWLCRCEASS